MYKIGNIKGLNRNEINLIENLVDFALPQDYLAFLTDYGYGEINGSILFQSADEGYIRNNFSDYMYLWDWEDEMQKEKVLKGLTIATTIDGDIICCVDNANLPYLILPRHSKDLMKLDKLTSFISVYFEDRKIKTDDLYFESYQDWKQKFISMIKNEQFDKDLITKIQKSFLEKYHFDRVFAMETQPKYVIQSIGGWVYFDLIYRSGIRVKYQSIFEQKAKEIIDFIEQQI